MTGSAVDPTTSAVPQPVTRADIAAWVLAAIALALIIKLHLLSSLLAGLLVFKLVDVLTPWLRVRALGRDGSRVLAVTLIATAVIAALVGIGLGIAAFLRNSDESVPLLMQRMAQIVEDARAILPEGLQRLHSGEHRDPAGHDCRVAALECQLAATRGSRHRPHPGARAHGHDHRRVAVDAEGEPTPSTGARSPNRWRGMRRAWPPCFSAWCLRRCGSR